MYQIKQIKQTATSIRFLAGILSAISTLLAYANPSQITSVNTQTYTVSQLGWDQAVSLNGYQPDHSFYFPISERLAIQKIVLHLNLAFSPKLTAETKIDLKLNNTLLRRLEITSPSSDIELPLARLVPNWQSLTFSASFASSDSLCDSDVWAYILPSTTLTVTYQETPFEGSLNQLPKPFIDLTALQPIPTLLVLPDAPSVAELSALLQVSEQLGEYANDAKMALTALNINQISKNQAQNNNMIFIGLAPKILENNPYLTTTDIINEEFTQALKAQYGLVTLNASKLNPVYGILILSGINRSALDKAVNAFMTPEFALIASGTSAFVKELAIRPTSATQSNWRQRSFKDMGYMNQSVSGLGHHILSYTIPLPNNRVPEDTKVTTYITAPITTDKDYAQLTLVMNGQKQSSFRLLKEQSQWSTTIPADAMKPGANKLEYLIDLHQADEQCSRENYNEHWATIQAESNFSTSFSDVFPQATLNQLPVPFASQVQVILPAAPASIELNLLSQLFFKLGTLNNTHSQRFNVYTSDEIDEQFMRSNNIILLGTPANNPWIKLVFDYVPIALNGTMRQLNTSNTKMQVTNNQATGLLELIQSPWNEESAILLVTGGTEKAVTRALNTLIDDKKRGTLNANIAVISDDDSVQLFNSNDSRYLNIKHRFITALRNWSNNSLYLIKNHPQFLIYFLAFFVPLFIYWRRKNK